MLSPLVVFGCLAAFAVPALCCSPQEYTTRDGQCCPLCHEGTVVRKDCTPLSGTRCSPCEMGTFMNKPNGMNKCFPCTSCNPGEGLFAKQECRAASDTICDVLTGYFCQSVADKTGCSLAEKHKNCVPGQRIKQLGTSRTDTMCEPCQPGSFSQDGVNCTVWTICSETQVKTREGNVTSDVVCGTASRRRYSYMPLLILILAIVVWLVRGKLTSKKH